MNTKTPKPCRELWRSALRPVLILMMLCVGVSAQASDNKVTLDVKNVALGSVLRAIEKQTDYGFFYSKEVIDVNVPVSIKVKNEAVTAVLDKLLPKYGISYTINNKQIALNKKNANGNATVQASKKAKLKVYGTVTDKNGEPLIGVSVVGGKGSVGVTTDVDGNYVVEVPAGTQLNFSYIGYNPASKKVTAAGKLDIVMEENTSLLNEVVVIGYGTIDKRELTSAVSHVSAKDFQSVASTDVSMLIQGKVPGLSVTNTASADPNSAASLQIRGVSSRSAGLAPLIVLDGVPGASLTNINPNDIASFDVLKDGAASAIYGTRGSNGVIVITTKKGAQDGRAHTTYSATLSWDKANRDLDMMTADDYRNQRIPSGDPAVDLGSSFDLFDLVQQVGFKQQHTLTVSGGGANTNYRVTADYRNADGIEKRGNREEYGARATVNHTTKGGLLSMNVNVAPRVVYRNLADNDVFRRAIEANPTSPIWHSDVSGRYYDYTDHNGFENPFESMALVKNKSHEKILDWDGTVKLNILPLFLPDAKYNQTLNTQVTFADHQYSDDNNFSEPSTMNKHIRFSKKGYGARTSSNARSLSFEWLGNYSISVKNHNIRAMVGYSYQYWQNSGFKAENYDFANDGIGADNLGSGDGMKEEGEIGMSSYKNDSKLIAFFGRVSYDYHGRYLLTASLRHEGSSRFGKNRKWGNFPAVSAGWRISEENFMRDASSWLNELKIRADFGVTGNQEFGNYLSLDTMGPFGYSYYNGQWVKVWGPGKNVNSDLHWEQGKNWNVGLDFSMFNNRLYGSFNYFNRHQQDLLGDYRVPMPPYLFTHTFVNVGTMKNEGFEFDITFDAVKTRDFSYTMNFIGTAQSNKFIDFSNSEFVGNDYYDVAYTENPYPNIPLQRIEEGRSIGSFYMFKYAGITTDGEWLIYDKDGDIIKGIQGTEADRQYVGNGLPKFTLSTNHVFRYKNFDLSLFFRGAFGFHIFNIHDFYYGTRNFSGNMLRKAYGKNSLVAQTQNPIVSDYFLERGDYFKLDQVSLGYTLPTPKARFMDSLRIYGTVRNVFTITKYSGMDPSNFQVNGLTPGAHSGRGYYPTTRQFIVGVQLDF